MVDPPDCNVKPLSPDWACKRIPAQAKNRTVLVANKWDAERMVSLFQLVMSMTAVRVGSIVFSSSESDDFFTNAKTSFRVDSREGWCIA